MKLTYVDRIPINTDGKLNVKRTRINIRNFNRVDRFMETYEKYVKLLNVLKEQPKDRYFEIKGVSLNKLKYDFKVLDVFWVDIRVISGSIYLVRTK